MLQRSRTPSSAETTRSLKLSTERKMASTEPHSFECGNGACCENLRQGPGVASTEPHSFECGNPPEARPSRSLPNLLQRSRTPSSAETQFGWIEKPWHSLASTEPHSFECGNLLFVRCWTRIALL